MLFFLFVSGGLMYTVNGESIYGQLAPLQGFMMNYSSGEILDTFSPDSQVKIRNCYFK